MRHGFRLAKLNRDTAHRMAMLRNMTTSLIKHERIETTLARAKAVRRTAEWMVTLGKEGTLKAKRDAARFVREKGAIDKLFGPFADRYKYRPGGYTRVIRTRQRKSDNAPLAYVEFIDRPGEMRAPRPVSAETYAKVLEQRKEHESKQPHI